MSAGPHKHLVLILAREFASNLATPVFIADEHGTLVFYNEAAESVTSATFAEAGEVPMDEWTEAFVRGPGLGSLFRRNAADADRARPAPSGTPARRFTSVDGAERDVEVTAFPLFAHADEFVGSPRSSGVGRRRLMRVTSGGAGARYQHRGRRPSPRRQHVVRRGRAGRRLGTRPRRGHGAPTLGFHLLRAVSGSIHLCLTHLHLDHLEGLRFFAPLWDERVELDIWGPPSR